MERRSWTDRDSADWAEDETQANKEQLVEFGSGLADADDADAAVDIDADAGVGVEANVVADNDAVDSEKE